MVKNDGRMYLKSAKNIYHTSKTPFLKQELKPYVDKELDSVIIFKSRHERWLDKEFWGKEEDKTGFIL